MSLFYDVIRRKSDELAELELFCSVCARSLRQATKAVEQVDLRNQVAEFLGEPSPYGSEEALKNAKERAAEIAKFAESQKAEGLPYLYSLGSIRLWALLEALVDELVVAAMREPDKCKDQELLSKLKGPLIEFRAASADEQAEFLAETLKQAVDAPLKSGVGRFEAMLSPVALGGSVDESVRRVLFELSQIRNVVVHKGGKADKRLIEGCPWLEATKGAAVHVSSAMFRRYLAAAFWYAVEIRGRVDERCGRERSQDMPQILARLVSVINLNDLLRAGSSGVA